MEPHPEAHLRGRWHSKDTPAGEHVPVYVSVPPWVETDEVKDGHPVVVVMHHAVGPYNALFLREFTDRLAEEGYIGVLPDLFHRVWSDTIPRGIGIDALEMNIKAMLESQNDAQMIADIQAAIDIAGSIPAWGADTEHVVVLGFCMGGRAAWLAGVSPELRGRIKGVVSFHGGNLWKARSGPGVEPAPGTAPAERFADLACPVQAHFGSLDQNPSLEDMAKLEALAGEHGKKVEFFTYEDAKHGFMCKDSQGYNEQAAEEAWPRMVSFLTRTVGHPPKRQWHRADL